MMSIAEGILDVALDTLRQHDDPDLFRSTRFGSYEWRSPDSLLFCWEAVTKDRQKVLYRN